jgi:hypothetical protein
MGITMKAITIKLPDALKVRLEAEAEKRKVPLSQVVREAAESYVVGSPVQKKLTAYDLIKDLCGSVKDAPPNLATDPKYMEGFGRDSMGDYRYCAARRSPRRKRSAS